MEFIDLDAQQRRLGGRLTHAMQKVLDHGKYIMGPEVRELEERLAEFCGARHAIACASGTDALLLALMAYGVGPGDAIFVPSFSFVAAAETTALLGATPVFVDVTTDDFLLDLESLEKARSEAAKQGLKPRGVIPVDLFGQPADYGKINPFAEKHELFVIADAAQSFGAELNGAKVGALANVTTTSFFPAKPLGCYGDGGALFTDDDDLVGTLRSLRLHGKSVTKYDNANVGINSRLDTLQAAILLEKLTIFPDEIRERNQVAEQYAMLLKDLVNIPKTRAGCVSVWAQYAIKVNNRDVVAAALKQEGVPTAVHYPKPLHLQAAYSAGPVVVDLTISEQLSSVVLSLPMHPYLKQETQAQISEALRQALAPGGMEAAEPPGFFQD